MGAFLKLFSNPKVAAYVAAFLFGRPELADDLVDICKRESRCQPVGAHEIDAHISRPEWHGQVSWGHLDPQCQPRDVPGGWATRGAFGLSAGAHWAYMWPCYDPRWFDSPWVSAWVAVRKYERKCVPKRQRRGWCRVSKEAWANNRRRDVI